MKYKGKGIKGWCKALAGSGYMLESSKATIKVFNEGGDYLFSRRSLQAAVEKIQEDIRLAYDPIDNPRNRATILAALRYWQRQLDAHRGGDFNSCMNIARDGQHEPLHASEIDVLCETINYA